MRKIWQFTDVRQVIFVSLFAGMDLLLLGCLRVGGKPGFAVEKNLHACKLHAFNFKHKDGTPVIAPRIEISKEEYRQKKADKHEKYGVESEGGKYYRSTTIEDIDGKAIRRMIEERFGKNVIIILLGGPPCQGYSKVNTNNTKGNPDERNGLVFEYTRVVRELEPDCCLMEEVPDIKLEKHKGIYDEFIGQVKSLPYNFVEQELCALHYGGNQMRWRYFLLMVHEKYQVTPRFPEADTTNVKRVKDFLPHVKYFYSGHFGDKIKTALHFMCTLTRSSPKWFVLQDGTESAPSIAELLLCFGVKEGEYNIPDKVSQAQLRIAIGNAVCTDTAHAIMHNLLYNVLGLEQDEQGLFRPRVKQDAVDIQPAI